MRGKLYDISDLYYKSEDEYHFASSKNISFATVEKDRTRIVFDDGKEVFSDKPLIALISHFYGNGYLFINKHLWLKPSNIVKITQEDSTNILIMKNQVTIELEEKDMTELLILSRHSK